MLDPRRPLDGPAGSERIARQSGGGAATHAGSPLSFCPNPPEHDAVTRAIHADYLSAGAQCVTADAFLAPFAPDRAVAVQQVRHAVALARGVAGELPVFLSLGPGGSPAVSADLARAGADAGANLLLFETFVRADEAASTLQAAAKATGGNVALAASLVVDADGQTLTGREPVVQATRWLIEAGASAVGLNCQPPDLLPGPVAAMAAVARPARVPVLVRPSAGIPVRVGETWVYPWAPQAWTRVTSVLRRHGADFVGGCCGAGPAHIAALAAALLHPNLDPDLGGNFSCE